MMDLNSLFVLANVSVLPAWLLLVFAPSAAVTRALVHSAVFPVVLGIAYVIGIVTSAPTGSVDMGSLSGLTAAFMNPHMMLVGWVHYLVFDLFVGAWEARDASRRGINHLFVVPCLILTFMLGPTGLLLYLVIRYFKTRSTTLVEVA